MTKYVTSNHDMANHNISCQVNHASRTEVSTGYLTQMFRAKIIVTSNPSYWEGGMCVKMMIPKLNFLSLYSVQLGHAVWNSGFCVSIAEVLNVEALTQTICDCCLSLSRLVLVFLTFSSSPNVPYTISHDIISYGVTKHHAMSCQTSG